MAIKWQSILKYTSGGTVSIFLLIVLLSNLAGMSYSDDGDKTCSDCYSKIEINSTYWEVCVEHAGDDNLIYKKKTRSRRLWINLDKVDLISTNPKANTELLVPTIKKYATIKHEEYGYLRPVKDGDCIIKRKTKSRPSPSRLIIHGINITETVKWGFELDYWLSEKIDIDPIWWFEGKSYDITKICDWRKVTTTKKKYLTEAFFNNYTCPTNNYNVSNNIGYCYETNPIWNSTNQTWSDKLIFSHWYDKIIPPKTIQWITKNKIKYIDYINTTVCDLQGYQINQFKVNFSLCNMYCDKVGKIVSCDSTIDGNGDGILQSGESGFSFDITKVNWKNFKKKVDSVKYTKLRDCVVKI